MPNGNLSELVKQELEKRGGNYSDLEAGLMAKNGPQKSPRKGKSEFFEPADGKGPLRNPMVRTCCSFCMSPALRWMVIIASLVVAGYAYGVAVENGWTDAGSKHVQVVAQKTGDFVNRVRGTVPAVDTSKEETPQESKIDETSQDVADHESQAQNPVSTEQSSTEKVDELNEDTPQEGAPEDSNEEVDQDAHSKPSEPKIVHHEPVEGLQKLVDVKLEDSKEKEPSSVAPKVTKTETAEASLASKVTDPVTKEEESSKKPEEENGEESKKSDLATSEHSSLDDEATEGGDKAGTKEEPETPVTKGSKVSKPKENTTDHEEEKTGTAKPNADSTSSVKAGGQSTAGNVAAGATKSSSTDKVVAEKEEAGSKEEPETAVARGSKVSKPKETTTDHEEEKTGTAKPNADKVVAEKEEAGSKEEPELPLPSGPKKQETKEAIKDLDEEKPDTPSSTGAAVKSDAENVDDKKSATHLPDNVMDTRRPGLSLG